MNLEPNGQPKPGPLAIAVFAWNEERVIQRGLRSLFEQSLFSELRARERACQVTCVVNGSTDSTAELARTALAQEQHGPRAWDGLQCQVAVLPERGKLKAWNRFVHEVSRRDAEFLFMMDADILIGRATTLWNMLRALEQDPAAAIAVDRPVKAFAAGPTQSPLKLLSLAASRATQSAPAQLCAQLYGIRAAVARRIYMPRDLPACEDGFIKALVCTDFLAGTVRPERIRVAPEAEHTFEAYTSPWALLRNQKRQILGQTVVHLLIDRELRGLSEPERADLAQTLQRRDRMDPAWLRRLIAEHLRRTRACWRLYPGLMARPLGQLIPSRALQDPVRWAAAAARLLASLASSWMAWRALKQGCTDYWPQPQRMEMGAPHAGPQTIASQTAPPS